MKFFIKTFGCQQNKADSERISSAFIGKGMTEASTIEEANYVIINTCMVRESAENRVYGLVENLSKIKEMKRKNNEEFKIIVTGCMVGVAFRDKSGKYLKKIRQVLEDVDEFMPIEEVGFDHNPIRQNKKQAWVPISNGCNNFCTFCIVPFTRGREISRPFDDIINECKDLIEKGYEEITLLGQNVNSYGADLIVGENNIQVMRDIDKTYFDIHIEELASTTIQSAESSHFIYNKRELNPIFVKHLGRQRIPTLFPHLLEEVALMGFKKVTFVSSNPWDFSQELIDVIAKNKNISRMIHLPVQSGSTSVLKRMNRWYTAEEYIKLIEKMRDEIPDVEFTTDIIVGFCNETEKEFQETVALCQKVQFSWAFVAIYSQRPMTAATKVFSDDVPFPIKRERWITLDTMINVPQYKLHKTPFTNSHE